MLTRLLHARGLDPGSESDLMLASADNPDGFWGILRFVAVNDHLLNVIGGRWDLRPASDEDITSKRAEDIRNKACFSENRIERSEAFSFTGVAREELQSLFVDKDLSNGSFMASALNRYQLATRTQSENSFVAAT